MIIQYCIIQNNYATQIYKLRTHKSVSTQPGYEGHDGESERKT